MAKADEVDSKERTTKNNNYVYIGAAIGAGILIVIATMIVIMILKRKNESEASAEYSYSIELSEETVLKTDAEVNEMAMENPLWTTSIMDDSDAFGNDFEETQKAVSFFDTAYFNFLE